MNEKRVRSPNYPALSLEQAVQAAQKVFDKIQTHAAPKDVVAKGLGYSGLNGASMSAMSALLKYGLLEKAGKEDLKLGARAMEILFPQSQGARIDALFDASREPALFADLLEHFKGEVPSDELLRSYLVRKGFASNALAQVLESFRDTIAMITREATAHGTNVNLGKALVKQEDEQTRREQVSTPPAGEREFLRSPLSSQTRVRILVEGPAGPKEIDKLIRLLTVQKEVMQEDDGQESA